MKRWIWLGILLVLFSGGVGCKKKKADPTKEPGFKDTTDPSKVVGLPNDPTKAGEESPKK